LLGLKCTRVSLVCIVMVLPSFMAARAQLAVAATAAAAVAAVNAAAVIASSP
jgi:hypothetical protein